MSLLERIRDNKAGCESLRAKGLLSSDEIEVLEELGILKEKKEVV